MSIQEETVHTQNKIEVKDVCFDYVDKKSSFAALDHINLSIEEGEFICILGSSGCGKSTLLGLLNGLNKAKSGKILLDGKPIAGPGPDRGKVALVGLPGAGDVLAQPLDPRLPVREFLPEPGKLLVGEQNVAVSAVLMADSSRFPGLFRRRSRQMLRRRGGDPPRGGVSYVFCLLSSVFSRYRFVSVRIGSYRFVFGRTGFVSARIGFGTRFFPPLLDVVRVRAGFLPISVDHAPEYRKQNTLSPDEFWIKT